MIELARVLLAAVFAVAGIAKLADREASRRAIRDFGAPAGLAAPLAILLPLAELAIATGLLPGATARFAAAGAAALLTLFTFALTISLLRGRKPDCHCFGRLHSAPAGPTTLARNLALAALALLVVSRPAPPVGLSALVTAGVGGLVVGQALVVYVLLRRYGRALRRIEELETGSQPAMLEIGTQAPSFALPAVGGGTVTLAGLLTPRRPVLLVFADPACGPCHALLPRVADWQQSLADRLTVAVVSRGDREDNLALASEHGVGNVLVQGEREVSELYRTGATPSAVLVGADGRLEHAAVTGAEAIERVVETLTPAVEQTPEQSPVRAHRELAAAAAVAGGIAVTAAVAQASPGAQRQQPTTFELQAIDAALRAAGPRLVAASQRSLKAVRAQATLKGGKTLRAKRKAARKALAAERRAVLALRTKVAKLPGTSREAHNVKVIVDDSLSLLAQSLAKRQQAVGAPNPRVGLRLLAEGQELFLKSVGAGAAAGKLLGHG